MKAPFHKFSVGVLLVFGCWGAQCQTTNSVLKFYIVSEQKIDSGRFIDTPTCPKLGYIASTPDLALRKLQEIHELNNPTTGEVVKANGGYKIIPQANPKPFDLILQLRAEDAERFESLTERAVTRKLLVMVDDEPVTAAVVFASIKNGKCLMTFSSEEERDRVKEKLKRLLY